jgi:hypothetical protein
MCARTQSIERPGRKLRNDFLHHEVNKAVYGGIWRVYAGREWIQR